MDEKSRSHLVQRDEQVKAASNLAGNAGLALAAAGASRWFFEGVDGCDAPVSLRCRPYVGCSRCASAPRPAIDSPA
jgi:hypothetical protein